jgi:hypothetical protein
MTEVVVRNSDTLLSHYDNSANDSVKGGNDNDKRAGKL